MSPKTIELFESNVGDYLISTDPSRLQFDVIYRFISEESYWAHHRLPDTMQTAIENSLNFGVYTHGRQVGFARVVTDYATFAWVCDVFILKEHRGHDLGKKLIQSVVHHPQLTNLRRLLLATRDAHELYHRYGGFNPLEAPERWMEKIIDG